MILGFLVGVLLVAVGVYWAMRIPKNTDPTSLLQLIGVTLILAVAMMMIVINGYEIYWRG